MLTHWAADDPAIHYYDSDYPSPDRDKYPDNYDDWARQIGLGRDVVRYKEIVGAIDGPLIELCCGTGRVTIPLAEAGMTVTAVDYAEGMIAQLRAKLPELEPAVAGRIEAIQQDATQMSLPRRDYAAAVIPFSSLCAIPEFAMQRRVLNNLHAHLRDGGLLVFDVANALVTSLHGDPTPRARFLRRNVHNGNYYMRFTSVGPMDFQQRQRLYGWYDETDQSGVVRRSHYSIHWRPLFFSETLLMLEQAGFTTLSMEGGFDKEPVRAGSDRALFIARKAAKA